MAGITIANTFTTGHSVLSPVHLLSGFILKTTFPGRAYRRFPLPEEEWEVQGEATLPQAHGLGELENRHRT